MADRFGSSKEKSYRSRNRAIAALVQSTTNVVTTDIEGLDSAATIALINSTATGLDSAQVLSIAGDAGLDSAAVLSIALSGYGERKTFIQSSAPTAGFQAGDFWWDRDGNTLYKGTASSSYSSYPLPAGSTSQYPGLALDARGNHLTKQPGYTSASFTLSGAGTQSYPNTGVFATHGGTYPWEPFDASNTGVKYTLTTPTTFYAFYNGNTDSGWIYKIEYEDGSYAISNNASPIVEPTSISWFDANGNSLNKTVAFGNGLRILTHPTGKKCSAFVVARGSYGTRNYDFYIFFSGADYWKPVGDMYLDSDGVRSYVTADHVNSLGISAGLDSAAVTSLIDSSYINARTTAGTDSASIINLITNNTTTVTKIDSVGALALIDSVAEADFAYNDINHDVYFATSLNPSLTVSHSLVFSGDERIVSSGARVTPFQTITVAKTSRTGNLRIYGAVHSVAALNATFPNSTAGYFSAYQPNISIRVPGESSNRTINALIVAQTTGTFVDNGDTTWTAPFEIKGVLAISGTDISNPTNIANTFYAWTSGLSDTNYSFNHSNTVYGLFPINASSVDYPIWTRIDQDSDFVASIIDSAYVSARAGGGGGGGVDSAATITLINSVIDSVGASRAFTYTYTATANQTTFTGADNNSNTLAYSTGNIITFLNGILLVDSDDYVATTGNSVVLNSPASLNDILNVVKFRASGSGGNLSHEQYKYTVSSPTTTFSGNDDKGNSLSYETGELQVFLNGILLIDSQDYTASNGTAVVLTDATDSNDVLAISKYIGGGSGSGGGGGGTDSATVIALSGELKGGMFRINPQSLSINTTIDSAENAHVAGPISFDSGVVLTINGNLVIS